jgi:hypothetical protein
MLLDGRCYRAPLDKAIKPLDEFPAVSLLGLPQQEYID